MINKIEYTEDQIRLIANYLSLDGFNHHYWSDQVVPDEYKTEITNLKSAIKKHYRINQQYKCVYCGCQNLINHGSSWHIEHIIPKETNDKLMFYSENLCVSCPECNQYKGKRKVLIDDLIDSNRSQDFIIVHPHYDNYDEHIECVDMIRIPINGSAKGKKTIRICKLCRFISLKFDGEIRDVDFYDLIDSANVTDGNYELMIESLVLSISERWVEMKDC